LSHYSHISFITIIDGTSFQVSTFLAFAAQFSLFSRVVLASILFFDYGDQIRIRRGRIDGVALSVDLDFEGARTFYST